MPAGLESLDVAIRERAAKRLRRGNLQVGLTVKRERGQGGYRVNRDVLDHLLSLLPEVRKRLPDVGAPSADGLLALRGVIEPAEDEEDEETRRAFEKALLAGFDAALADLATMREAEGGRLAGVLADQLTAITGLCEQAPPWPPPNPTPSANGCANKWRRSSTRRRNCPRSGWSRKRPCWRPRPTCARNWIGCGPTWRRRAS